MVEVDDAIRQSLGRGLADEDIWKIAELAERKEFMGGDTIVRQFDKNSDLIIVLDGGAEIRTFGGEPITTVGPGSIIGEVSLVDEQLRSATVRSVQFTDAAIIPADKLREVLDGNAAIAAKVYRNIAQTLCTRLRHVTIHIDGLMGG